MWRSIGSGLMAALALLAACGGGSEGAKQACRPDISLSALQTRTNRVPQYSLEEAIQRVPWLRIPSDLPPDATIGRVAIQTVPGCPNDIMWASFRIDGGNYWILLEASVGQSGDSGTPVMVDGVTGLMETRNDANISVIVSWERGGHGYSAVAKFGGELTQERLLEILGSMPE